MNIFSELDARIDNRKIEHGKFIKKILLCKCLNNNGLHRLWKSESDTNRIKRKAKNGSDFSFNFQLFAGITYYVKNGGNDGADGLSDGNAWETIGKVNSTAFSAGDIIMFKSGSTWNEKLIADNAGTSGNPITYEDYDSGTKPTINLNNSIGDWGFVFEANYVTFRNFIVKNIPSFAVIANSAGINNLICEGVDVDHTDVSGAGFFFAECNNIILTDCTVNDAQNNGFAFYGSPADTVFNVLCTDCIAHDIRNNDGFGTHADGEDNDPGSNFVFVRCIAYNCEEEGFDMQEGTDISLIDCEEYNNDIGGIYIGADAVTALIDGCYSHDSPATASGGAMKLFGSGIIVRNCLVLYPRQSGFQITGANGVDLYNNTVVGTGGSASIDFSGTVADIVIKNNICKVASGRSMRFLNAAQEPDNAAFTFDYNCWFSVGDAVQFYDATSGNLTFAEYQAYGQDANGFEGDPDLNGSYRLQLGSPAINTGVDLSGEGFTDDKDGNTRPIGSGWDMGAYEYGSAKLVAVLKD